MKEPEFSGSFFILYQNHKVVIFAKYLYQPKIYI